MYATRAGDVPRPMGAAAEAIIGANWPAISESAIDEVADNHQSHADRFNIAGDVTRQDRDIQAQLLQGKAGDAHYRSMTGLMTHDFGWSDHLASKVRTARGLASVARGTKMRLAQIMETAGPEYNSALRAGDPEAVAAVVAKYQPEVNSIMADAWTDLAQQPPPTPPPTDPNGSTKPLDNNVPRDGQRDPLRQQKDEKTQASVQLGDETQPGDARKPVLPGKNNLHGPLAVNQPTDDPNNKLLPGGEYVSPANIPPPQVTQQPQISPFTMPMSPSAGSPSSGSSGMGGLGSIARPPISPASFPSSPASAPTPPSALMSNPISQATSQFQSGLASGLGSSGAVPPAALQQPLQPYVNQQSMPVAGEVAAAATPAAGTPGSVVPAEAAAPVSHSSAGVAQGSGGPMMAGPVAGGAPLAPYSPPGAGSAPPPSVPTSPAGSPAAAGPAGPAGSAGVGPVVAGPAGAIGAAGVSSLESTNPDALAAQEILAALVKSTPSDRPMFWAVSVLRSPVGPQTLIANTVGGGTYLPATVHLPSTLRLAALDPALPAGWAAPWMGWQAPSAILVDHFERLRYVTAGVRVSAIATSELWPRRPDCDGDFVAVRYEELLRSTASPLTGAHRLTVTDPAMSSRLSQFLRGGDERLTNWVAVALTRAVVGAAAEYHDGTGQLVISPADIAILDSMSKTLGPLPETTWHEYEKDVATRDNSALLMPEIFAPRDADDSPSSQHARLWYEHYYRASRIVELVMCWKTLPPNVFDIAYCGIAAGFGAAVAAAVSEMELRRDQQLLSS